MRLVFVRVVLIGAQVLLVVLRVHSFRPLLGRMLRLELVDLVHTLGLDETVDLAADETGDGLFGKGVADGFACSQECEHVQTTKV